MTPKHAIYLFDIDGTLITTGGTGRNALEKVFDRRYNRLDACDGFSFAGMTDRAILRQGLEAIGEPATEDHIDTMLDNYLEHLSYEVTHAPTYFVHPGMVEALEHLSKLDDVAVGLGTGNVERGARIKLERVGLNGWFDFGGFGCDAELRAELILRGAQRGAEKLGRPLDACTLIIIGDTAKDVAAAHANGGLCLGVTTGGGTEASLREAGADHIVTDLAHPGALELLLAMGTPTTP